MSVSYRPDVLGRVHCATDGHVPRNCPGGWRFHMPEAISVHEGGGVGHRIGGLR